MKYLVFLVMMFSSVGYAEVTELSLDGRKMKDARLPYFPGKTDFENYVGLNVRVQGWKFIFTDLNAYFYGDEAQVRYVGLKFTSGFHLNEYVDINYHHESSHSADQARNDPLYPDRAKFPIENSFGFRINFIPKN